MDEPCLQLEEMNKPGPPGKGWRRYQRVIVVRNDRPAEYEVDLGAREDFDHEEINVQGAVQDAVTGKVEILHTVAELKEIADFLRAEPKLSFDRRDIWKEYFDGLENRIKLATATSTFGPGGPLVRG